MSTNSTPLTARILLADDDATVRRMLTQYLTRRGAHVVQAASAKDALAYLATDDIELLITDVNMPGESGLHLLEEVKSRWPDMPVILITGAMDAETVVEALHSGADRYLMKPFSMQELVESVEQAMSRRATRLQEKARHAQLEQLVREQEAEVRGLVLRGVRSLVEAVEAKDPYTRGHSRRVMEYALILAEEFGISTDWVRLGGELHDIGKIGVPDAVLNKQSRLTEEEFAKVREHPIIGRRIVEPLIDIEEIQAITLWHHERWDGSGYPDRLRGTEIPHAARIIAVADTLDAMTSHRAYRPAHAWETAVQEIRAQAGVQFDPSVVAGFNESLPLLRKRYEELNPTD